MSWLDGLKAKILIDEPLSRHTTLRVAGPRARLWVEPETSADLSMLLRRAKDKKVRYLIIGSGSKLLIKRKVIPLAVHLTSPYFTQCYPEGSRIAAGGGLSLSKLVKTAYDNGLGGLEFLSGIPASVGGAVMLNAGVSWPRRREIGALVDTLEVMDKNGNCRTLERKDLEFDYRHSNLKPYIILGARIRLFKKRKENIRIKMRKFLHYRKATQESGYASAGCIFKNPNGASCGRLIDLCGLKGRRIGDAAISNKHANFIINLGRARYGDVAALMALAQKKVKERFGILLEPELQVV